MVKTAVAEVPDFFYVYEHIMAGIPYNIDGRRVGQYVFNMLQALRSDVCNMICSAHPTMDPYYWTTHEWKENQEGFWDLVIDLWEE